MIDGKSMRQRIESGKGIIYDDKDVFNFNTIGTLLGLYVFYLVIGTIAFSIFEHWSFDTAFFYAANVLLSVGYVAPESAPLSNATHWFCVFYIFCSASLIIMCISILIDYHIALAEENKQKLREANLILSGMGNDGNLKKKKIPFS